MNEQIEEMAKLLCGQSKSCLECSVHKPCLMTNCAELLYNAGYRKASDVAREIFEEIEQYLIVKNWGFLTLPIQKISFMNSKRNTKASEQTMLRKNRCVICGKVWWSFSPSWLCYGCKTRKAGKEQ